MSARQGAGAILAALVAATSWGWAQPEPPADAPPPAAAPPGGQPPTQPPEPPPATAPPRAPEAAPTPSASSAQAEGAGEEPEAEEERGEEPRDEAKQKTNTPPPAPSAAPSAQPESVKTSCTEYLPRGATRPQLEVSFPERGLTGHEVRLTVVVTHGVGETVMPGGFRIQRGSDALLALQEADWYVPEPEGGSAPLIQRPQSTAGTTATTTVELPFVALPAEPGRHLMTLPSVPITVARANGQVMTVCTPSKVITIDDPIANEPNPEVRPNPPPRPQLVEWVAAKWATLALVAAVLLGALFAWIWNRFFNRPTPEPALPPELPWVWANRELRALRDSDLLATEQFDEFFDRVDNCCRQYLGERYGFDGLESTSGEIRRDLKRVQPPLIEPERVDKFLEDTDFVKYAEVTPTRQDCIDAIDRAELIIQRTMPPHAEVLEKQREQLIAGRKAA